MADGEMTSAPKYIKIVKDLFNVYKTTTNFQRVAGCCRLVSVEKGRVKAEFDVIEEHTNPFNSLHGGFTSTLVDIMTTTAIMSTERGYGGVSVDLNLSYLAPAYVGDTVIIDASVTKMGRTLCYTRADLYRKSDNNIIATGLHTKAFPPLKSKV